MRGLKLALSLAGAVAVAGFSSRPALAEGPGLGGGYATQLTDGPGLGGGYGKLNDGPGLGGGYATQLTDGPGLGGGYAVVNRPITGPGGPGY